jgi:type IV pilus assembly protein PilB
MKWLTREIKFQSRRKAPEAPAPPPVVLKAPEPESPAPPSAPAPPVVEQPKPQTAAPSAVEPTGGHEATTPTASVGPASPSAAPANPVQSPSQPTHSPPLPSPERPQPHALSAGSAQAVISPPVERHLLGSGATPPVEKPHPGPLIHDAFSPVGTVLHSPDSPSEPGAFKSLVDPPQERESEPLKVFETADEERPAPADLSDLSGGPIFADSLVDSEVPQPLVPRAADESVSTVSVHQFQGPFDAKPELRAVPGEAPEQEQGWDSEDEEDGPTFNLDDALHERSSERPILTEPPTDVEIPQPLVPRATDESPAETLGHQFVGSAALKPELRAVPEQATPEPALRPVSDAEERDDHGEAKPAWSGLRSARHAGRSKRLIGDVVVDLGYADRETVERAVASSKAEGKPTGQVLVEQGVLRQDQLAQVIAERFGLDYIDLSVYEVDMGAANLLDIDAVKRYQAVPVGYVDDGTLLLAMADPTNVLTVDDVAMITSRRVRVAVASAEDVKILITKLGRMEQSIEDIVEDDHAEQTTTLTEEADQDAPAIKLVHSIIAQAVSQGASDIHVNPEEGDTRVLFRVDGVLYPAATVRKRMAMSMVSRIKIMSDLDIAERRVPQDGRFAVTIDRRRIDVRVVTLPLVYGEGTVMRILDKGVVVPNLEYLGMQKVEQDRFDTAIHRPNGAVLVTGPTGSGKSTTLYAALSVLNNGERSILTIEDPVESRLAGVKQMQIASKAGVTFETGLRSMLRADPDVIMVGEIRDRETAHIAVEAALTGHMVLSTLHTRDAPSALGRLMDMGIEPFLVSSSIDCVVAQRLVRMLCQHCRRPMKLSPAVIEKYSLQGSEPYEPVGCSRCGGSGYRGRVGLYEVMLVDEEIRGQILEHASVDEIAATAVRNGMRRLHEDGMDKVREGQTSIAEVERMAASLL